MISITLGTVLISLVALGSWLILRSEDSAPAKEKISRRASPAEAGDQNEQAPAARPEIKSPEALRKTRAAVKRDRAADSPRRNLKSRRAGARNSRSDPTLEAAPRAAPPPRSYVPPAEDMNPEEIYGAGPPSGDEEPPLDEPYYDYEEEIPPHERPPFGENPGIFPPDPYEEVPEDDPFIEGEDELPFPEDEFIE